MIGLGCLLYGPITRRTQTIRIITAASIMISLQGATLGLENMVAKNLALIPVLYGLAIVPIFAGTFMLMKHPKPAKPKNPARHAESGMGT